MLTAVSDQNAYVINQKSIPNVTEDKSTKWDEENPNLMENESHPSKIQKTISCCSLCINCPFSIILKHLKWPGSGGSRL